MSEFKPAGEIVREALADEVRRLLDRCTEPQRAFFDKVHPEGLARMSEERLRTAIGLCQRTVRKNERRP